MRLRLLTLVCVFALQLCLAPRGKVAQAAISVLIARPTEGHSGDPFYVAGYGFRPNRQLAITMACPNYWDWRVHLYGNIERVPGPRTNAQGEFTRFKFTALNLRHDLASGCTIWADDGVNPWGPDVPGLYTILRPNQRLASCDRRICGSVAARPFRVRAGFPEHLHIAAWPGATATISIAYPGGRPLQRQVTLDVRGTGTLRLPVTSQIEQTTKVKVRVRFHLGQASGRAAAQFVIVH
jgi:hypothetical protein